MRLGGRLASRRARDTLPRVPALRRRSAATAIVLAALSPFMCGPILEDEFLCNEAIAHLQSCCTRFEVDSNFCADTVDCNDSHASQLSVAQSQCILAKDCDALAPLCVQLPTQTPMTVCP